MKKFLQMLISRNRISRIVLFGCALSLAVLATAALPERANARNTATFTSSKILCAGSPDTTVPSKCQPAQIVASGVPVFYVITVSNPIGQPAQTITLNEASPGFPLGFNPGTVSCKDQSGGTVPVTPVGVGIPIYNFTLPPALAPPSSSVICTISGTFSSSAIGTTKQNSVVVSNGAGGQSQTNTVNTFITATTPLTADLSVTKTVSPNSVGVGTSTPLPATVARGVARLVGIEGGVVSGVFNLEII